MEEMRRPAAGGTAAGLEQQGRTDGSATGRNAQPRKWARVVAAFLDRGLRGLNRFEAWRELRDSCLNTTVSQIERRGVKILRREETVRGAFGPVHCCRYWLSPEGVRRARELLGYGNTTDDGHVPQNALSQAGEARAPAS